jgi:hypothetical protein
VVERHRTVSKPVCRPTRATARSTNRRQRYSRTPRGGNARGLEQSGYFAKPPDTGRSAPPALQAKTARQAAPVAASSRDRERLIAMDASIMAMEEKPLRTDAGLATNG